MRSGMVWFGFCALLIACASIKPEAGVWKYAEFSASENTCTSDVVSNGSGFFTLTHESDGSVKITPDDGTDPFKCTLAGTQLSCPERIAFKKDYTSMGAKATLEAKVKATATLTDAKNMTGEQTGSATCSGTDCTLAESLLKIKFPCSFKVKFTASWNKAK